MVPHRGIHRHQEVEDGGEGQQRCQPRRLPVVPEHGQVGARHHRPRRPARRRRHRLARQQPGDQRDGRRDVDQTQPQDRAGQQPRAVPQLRVRTPRDHAPQVGQSRRGPHTVDPVGEPQPDPAAAAPDRARQRDVVDHRLTDGLRDTRPLGGPCTQQDAAARRRRGPRPLPVHPPERVELGEEVDEGGNHQPLPDARHPQPRHLRDQVEAVLTLGPGRGDEFPQAVRLVGDVGVRQQQELGFPLPGQRHPVPQRPELPRPPGLRLTGCHHRQRQPPAPRGQRTCELTRAVAAAVVDQDDLRVPGIVLGEQRRQAHRQHLRLVPRGDDHGHRGPALRVPAPWEPLVRPPEEPLAQQQPHPHDQRTHGDPGNGAHPSKCAPHRRPRKGCRLW